MKLHIDVIPNAYNDSGVVFIVSKKFWLLKFELGRCISVGQLRNFLKQYDVWDGLHWPLPK